MGKRIAAPGVTVFDDGTILIAGVQLQLTMRAPQAKKQNL